jgi:hypothetical protein
MIKETFVWYPPVYGYVNPYPASPYYAYYAPTEFAMVQPRIYGPYGPYTYGPY